MGPGKGYLIQVTDPSGEKRIEYKPTLGEPEIYVQLPMGFMYFRYFMWNFRAGRIRYTASNRRTIQRKLDIGIKFIDEPRIGPQEGMPPE
ncbi:MAG: hypothetical protein R2744_05310 [Bacteroidales bacterium]